MEAKIHMHLSLRFDTKSVQNKYVLDQKDIIDTYKAKQLNTFDFVLSHNLFHKFWTSLVLDQNDIIEFIDIREGTELKPNTSIKL